MASHQKAGDSPSLERSVGIRASPAASSSPPWVPRLACQAVRYFGQHGLASNPWHPAGATLNTYPGAPGWPCHPAERRPFHHGRRGDRATSRYCFPTTPRSHSKLLALLASPLVSSDVTPLQRAALRISTI